MKNKYKRAVCPGSFDPITNGHVDIIGRASKIFDTIYIAVIENPDKSSYFPLSDRVEMARGAVSHIKNVKVESFSGLLVDYAERVKANAVIRGLRAVSDFEYEFQMALTNRKMKPDLETIFFMTDYKYSYLSSSFVKQIARLGGKTKDMVPAAVIKKLAPKKINK